MKMLQRVVRPGTTPQPRHDMMKGGTEVSSEAAPRSTNNVVLSRHTIRHDTTRHGINAYQASQLRRKRGLRSDAWHRCLCPAHASPTQKGESNTPHIIGSWTQCHLNANSTRPGHTITKTCNSRHKHGYDPTRTIAPTVPHLAPRIVTTPHERGS